MQGSSQTRPRSFSFSPLCLTYCISTLERAHENTRVSRVHSQRLPNERLQVLNCLSFVHCFDGQSNEVKQLSFSSTGTKVQSRFPIGTGLGEINDRGAIWSGVLFVRGRLLRAEVMESKESWVTASEPKACDDQVRDQVLPAVRCWS